MIHTNLSARLIKQLKRGTMICALSFAVTSASFAQVPDAQFGTAFPGRASQQIEQPDFIPEVKSRVNVKESKMAEAPEGAEAISFTLDRLNVTGVSVYSDEEVMSVYNDKLGQTITLADLYRIAADLTRQYRNDGYILTQVVVPAQTIEDGTASLRVVEGYIDNVIVRGEESKPAADLINKIAQRVHTEDKPLNTLDLEHTLLIINDLPGVKARSVLSPSKTKTGAADLEIIVDRSPYNATASIDNYGTRFLGPIQMGGAVSANSFFGMNETITGQLYIAPDIRDGIELFYASLGYNVPIWSYGTTLDLFISNTHTEPGSSLDQFDVRGRSQYMSATIEHPFVRTRNFSMSGRAKLDYRNSDSRNNIIVDPTRKDRIRAIRLGGRFEYLDRFFNAGFNVLDLEVAQGLSLLGSSNQGSSTLSRPAGDPEFFKVNAEFQSLQRVSSSLNVLLGARGQWSNNAQLSAEEFGVGGKDFGRGYDPSEIVGDDGVAGKVELQWSEPFNVPAFDKYHVYTFFDAGRVWNDDPITASQKAETITSTGLGVRATFANDVNAGLMVALPLNRTVQTTGDQGVRLFFNLSKEF
jgi:hemolysin activation/secretion protein